MQLTSPINSAVLCGPRTAFAEIHTTKLPSLLEFPKDSMKYPFPSGLQLEFLNPYSCHLFPTTPPSPKGWGWSGIYPEGKNHFVLFRPYLTTMAVEERGVGLLLLEALYPGCSPMKSNPAWEKILHTNLLCLPMFYSLWLPQEGKKWDLKSDCSPLLRIHSLYRAAAIPVSFVL